MILRDLRPAVRDLSVGFWFVAVCVAAGGPVLAVLVAFVDRAAGPAGVLGSFVISPTSARTILSAIAGSLITIASLTSSLTIVTLQLLSNQYTPRAIRGFLTTRLSQVVFGAFLGIFLYCLLLLVVVRAPGDENDPFVPSLGVALAIVLAGASLVLLVVFVHRLSQLIQVSTMTASIRRATEEAITAHHTLTGPAGEHQEPAPVSGPSLRLPHDGYVVRVEVHELLAELRATGARAEVLVRPGDLVTPRTPVLRLDEEVQTATQERLLRHVRVGPERDIDQDPIFGFRLLVDIALRALSPGINDPTTAVNCLDRLQVLLELLAGRRLPARQAADQTGALVLRRHQLADYLLLVAEISPYSVSDARVAATLLRVLAATARAATDSGDLASARDVRSLAADLSAPALESARTDVARRRLAATIELLEGEDVRGPGAGGRR